MKSVSISAYPPAQGGLATYSSYLYTELAKITDHQIISWNYNGLIRKTLAPVFHFNRLRNACNSHDIVHVQYALGDLMPLFLPMLWLARLGRKTRIVLTLHESYDNVPLQKMVIAYHNLLYKIADRLIVHSPQQKDRLPRSLKGMAIAQFHGVIYRANPNRQPKEDTILLPGFINPWKGHDVALKALAKVKQTFPKVKLIIVGKPHNKEFAQEIHDLAKGLGLEKNIEWKTGYVPEAEFFDYYRTCEIGILPYRRITMSGVLCHILSWRLPTVMSDLDVFRWFTADMGIYCRVDDPDDLAKKVIQLLRSSKRQNLISKGFCILSKRYSWKEQAKVTLRIYKELV